MYYVIHEGGMGVRQILRLGTGKLLHDKTMYEEFQIIMHLLFNPSWTFQQEQIQGGYKDFEGFIFFKNENLDNFDRSSCQIRSTN